jgi:hypothetical protein
MKKLNIKSIKKEWLYLRLFIGLLIAGGFGFGMSYVNRYSFDKMFGAVFFFSTAYLIVVVLLLVKLLYKQE